MVDRREDAVGARAALAVVLHLQPLSGDVQVEVGPLCHELPHQPHEDRVVVAVAHGTDLQLAVEVLESDLLAGSRP